MYTFIFFIRIEVYIKFRKGYELSDEIIKIIMKKENESFWILWLVYIDLGTCLSAWYIQPNGDTKIILATVVLAVAAVVLTNLKSLRNSALKCRDFEYKYATVLRMYLYTGKRYAVETTEHENYMIDIVSTTYYPGERIICIKYSPATTKVYKVEW